MFKSMQCLTLILSLLLISACTTNRSAKPSNSADRQELSTLPSSDYEKNLTYPESVYSLEFVKQENFEDPLWGTQLRYSHIFSKKDIVDVYVYPIPATNWDEQVAVLKSETNRVIEEIKEAVKQNYYQDLKVKGTEEIAFGEWKGMKSSLDLTMNDGALYRSLVYLFIQQDKFIKLRFSLLKGNALGLPDEDKIAQVLITAIKVPPESKYMHAMRKQHREQQAQELLQLLIQAANQQKKEK